MTEQNDNKLIYMRWDENDFMRPSLTNFSTQVKEYVANVISASYSVNNVYVLFDEQETIWPDQCDYAIKMIILMEKPVSNLCVLLDKTSQLPIVVIPLRYELLTELYYAQEQMQLLSSMIAIFRTSCRNVSKQAIKQRKEILQRLDLLLQSGEDIAQQARTLFDLAHMQGRV